MAGKLNLNFIIKIQIEFSRHWTKIFLAFFKEKFAFIIRNGNRQTFLYFRSIFKSEVKKLPPTWVDLPGIPYCVSGFSRRKKRRFTQFFPS